MTRPPTGTSRSMPMRRVMADNVGIARGETLVTVTPMDPTSRPWQRRCMVHRDAGEPDAASHDDVRSDADEGASDERLVGAPVAVASEETLQGVPKRELPSVRWQRRSRRVMWPIIGVSVLSSAAIGLLAAVRPELAPIGVGSLFLLPTLVSCLLAVMKPEAKAGRIVGDAVMVQGVGVLAAALFLGEGALCLLLAAPFLASATVPFALLAQAGCRRALARADTRHRALLGLAMAIVMPWAATALDAWLYGDDETLAISEAAVVVSASQEQVWSSLRELDVQFDEPPGGLASLLPVPTAIVGAGAHLGARREVRFDNGVIEATVTSLQPPSQYEISLVVKDAGREFFDHWIELRSSRFTIEPVSERQSRVIHTTTYRPLLFPRVVFGPLERAFGDEIQHRLLAVYADQVLGHRPSTTMARR
jgi:hypothetical protein